MIKLMAKRGILIEGPYKVIQISRVNSYHKMVEIFKVKPLTNHKQMIIN